MTDPHPLPPTDSPSPQEMVARLRADQRRRWTGGERVLAETYRDRLPTLGANREAFLELVISEWLLREELGETPLLDEYVRRFPEFEHELRRQLEMHRAGGKPVVTAAPPPARPDEPEAVGRYRLQTKVGAGAFGTVYRAHDPELDRDVALKLLKPSALGSVKAVERFRREARAAARMLHPNIVPVHDAGQHGAQFYIASAFIAGQPLADLIPEGGMEPGRAVRLVLQLLDALAYAHSQNVLHRDVKPGNILVDDREHVYLTDFGLAGWVEPEQTRVTQLGAVIGTPSYMAPEQAAGDTANVGPAADAYSAGVVLYELLTGQVPFSGPIAVVLHNVLNTEPEPISSMRPGIDPKLEAICAKAMAKRSAERYPDAAAFAAAARQWQDRPSTLVAAPAPGPVREALPSTPTVSYQPGVAVAETVDAGSITYLGPRASPTTLDVRHRNRLRWGLVAVGVVGLLALAAGVIVVGIPRDTGPVRPDAERRTDPELPWSPGPTRVLPVPGPERWVAASTAVSPDGTRVVAGCGDGGVRVWDLRTGKMEWTLSGHPETVWAVAVSPDGRYALSGGQHHGAGRDYAIRLWDLTTGREVRQLVGHTGIVSGVAFVDNRRAVSSSWDAAVRVWDVETGKELGSWKQDVAILGIVPVPDGKQAVLARHDGVVRVISLANGEQVKHLGKHDGLAEGLAISPDGSLAASGGEDETILVWDLRQGEQVCQLRGHESLVRSLAFLPDGRRLLSASHDKTVRLWDVSRREEVMRFEEHQDRVSAVSVSPAGDFAVSGGFDGNVRVWNLPK